MRRSRGELNSDLAFPGPPAGTWPKSTMDFADGIWSDNDKGDR